VTNKEIAQELTISPNTVKVHLRNIYTKLGVSTRTEAVREGMARGLVALPEVESAELEPLSIADSEPAVVSVPPAEAIVEPVVVDREMPAFPPTPVEVIPTSQPATPIWQKYLPVLGIAGILLLALFAWRTWGQPPTTPAVSEATDTPFQPTPIEGSDWVIDRPMPTENAGMASTAIGLNLYFIGGETANGEIRGDVHVFNAGDHQWQTAAAKPSPVTNATAAVLGGEIYVVGGHTPNGATDVVEAYSPIEGAWRARASLPQPVDGGLLLSDGSFLYLIGGKNGEVLANMYVYSPATNSWGLLPAMPTARTDMTGGEIAGILYVVGGTDGTSELDTCEAYEIASETWRDCPPMLLPRNQAGAAPLNGNLYVFGGGTDGEVGFGEFYNTNSETWQVINMPMLADNPQWLGLAVAIVETHIYAVGGQQGGNTLDNNFTFSPLSRVFLPSITIDRNVPVTEE
jgi:N-acetylneuraminic acid mutarotase